jgi:hypothetical protein
MATYNKFNIFVQDVTRKVHNLNADTLKLMFTDTAPVTTNAVKADITEIAAGNGYTAGGTAIAGTGSSQTAGVDTLVGTDTVFTASGGSIGPFRYVVLYNSTATGGPLISWYDAGSEITITDTNTFTVSFSGNNIFTLT